MELSERSELISIKKTKACIWKLEGENQSKQKLAFGSWGGESIKTKACFGSWR
jgi:hypothetical protein